MFNKILRREKPRVFLGAIAVAPRVDIKRHLEAWTMLNTEDIDAGLRQHLKEIFLLPSAHDIEEPKKSDLGLDVIIPKFQVGDALELSLGDFGVPLLWRPKVTVSSRLYYLKSEKTKASFTITEKMSWRQYFGRLFSWRAFISFRPTFDSDDMEFLLYQACHKLLLKMKKIR